MVTAAHRPSAALDRVDVVFDDRRLVANAGLVLPGLLAAKLDTAALLEQTLGGAAPARPRVAAAAAAKALTAIFGILAGADSFDDLDVLQSGASSAVLEFAPRSGARVGRWLRGCGLGQVRQLDAVAATLLQRAWQAGAKPERLILDLDSSIHPAYGYAKQGAELGYTRLRGYHPLYATSAETGEVVHVRLRRGRRHTAHGACHFFQQTIQRCRRAGHHDSFLVRADAGFFDHQLLRSIRQHGGHYSVSVPLRDNVQAAIAAIPDDAWQRLPDYDGIAEIAETTLAVRRRLRPRAGTPDPLGTTHRLIVRRVLNHNRSLAQQPLFDEFRYLALATSRADPLATVEADHRAHAQIELVIRDLKDAGLAHLPSGRMHANMAWTILATIAHNLQRWTAILGLHEPRLQQHRTIRTRYLALPGRISKHARRTTLHLPARWPWRNHFQAAIERLNALPAPT